MDDEASNEARSCKVNFMQARDEVLQAAQWRFAKRQETLSRLPAVPASKWLAAYQLPNDFIRLCEIEGTNAWLPREYFDRYGNTLVIGQANQFNAEDEMPATITIEYIFRQTDNSTFDPLFVRGLALVLAAAMARTITGSDNKARELMQEYSSVVLPMATTLNSQPIYTGSNHPIRKMMTKSFLNRSRRQGGSGWGSNVGYDNW